MRSPDREQCSLDDTAIDGDGRAVPRHQRIAESSSVAQCLHDLARGMAEVLEQVRMEHMGKARAGQHATAPEHATPIDSAAVGAAC
jgi:hypothetical protein